MLRLARTMDSKMDRPVYVQLVSVVRLAMKLLVEGIFSKDLSGLSPRLHPDWPT